MRYHRFDNIRRERARQRMDAGLGTQRDRIQLRVGGHRSGGPLHLWPVVRDRRTGAHDGTPEEKDPRERRQQRTVRIGRL